MKKKVQELNESSNEIKIEDLVKNIKLSKEEVEKIKNLADRKFIINYLIDQYYQSQDYRIKAENQSRSLMQGYDISDEEHSLFIDKNLQIAQNQEKLNFKYLDILTNEIPICRWLRSIKGIGPVLSAYLYATLDVTHAQYATNFLSYAGLNDNNNPWLGKEKASKLVKDIIKERKVKFDTLVSELRDFGITDKKIKDVVKLAKKDDIDFESVCKIFGFISGMDGYTYFDGINYILFYEYIHTLINSDYVGDWTFHKVSENTSRSFETIVKGTKTNADRKTSKKTYLSVDDLISYLSKPPYNLDLKKKCFMIGKIFIFNKNRGSLYGKIYTQRLLDETAKNERGEYADQAAKLLEEKNYGDNDTYKCLSQGKLSNSHLTARARRYAVKLFISHVHEAMYYAEYHTTPPTYYCIEYQGHHDYIAPEVDYKKFLD